MLKFQYCDRHSESVGTAQERASSPNVNLCTGAKKCLARGTVPCDILFVGEAPNIPANVIGRPFIGEKAPTHVAYQVKNCEGKKAIWTRIGSAWAHADGEGFNIQLDALPIDGKVTLRVPAEKEE